MQDARRKTQDARESEIETVFLMPEGTPVANYGFDITPAELISGYITEKGIIEKLDRKQNQGLISDFQLPT